MRSEPCLYPDCKAEIPYGGNDVGRPPLYCPDHRDGTSRKRATRALWSGSKDQGSTVWTDEEWRKVTEFVLACDRWTSYRTITESTRVKPRTVRKIINESDGVLYLLRRRRGKVMIATYADDEPPGSQTLRRAGVSLLRRVRRRQLFAERLPRLQGRIQDRPEVADWPNEEEEPEWEELTT